MSLRAPGSGGPRTSMGPRMAPHPRSRWSPLFKWLRRTAAVLLGIALAPAVFASLVVLRLDSTFLEPSYYPGLLARSDVYRFVMVDVLESAIDEARRAGSNPVDAYAPSTSQVAAAVNRGLPPEDLEAIVAPAVLAVVQYLLAERDDLAIDIQVGDNAKALALELRGLVSETVPGAYDWLLYQEIEPQIERAAQAVMASNSDASRRLRYLFASTHETGDRLTLAASRVLTPEWTHGQVMRALDDVTSYLLGDSDDFEVRVRLGDEQVLAAREEAKAILSEAGAYDQLLRREVEPAIRAEFRTPAPAPDAAGEQDPLDRLVEAVLRNLTPEWLQGQVGHGLDEVTPYLAGRSDEFEVRMRLPDDAVEAVEREIRALLWEDDAYDLILEQAEETVRDSLGGKLYLPYGLEVTEDELVQLLRNSTSPDWLRRETETVADAIASYATGRTDDFSVEVSLAGKKADVEGPLSEMIGSKLREAILALPPCRTPLEEAVAAARVSYGVPDCVPGGAAASTIIDEIVPRETALALSATLGRVPDRTNFTDSNLRSVLTLSGGEETVELLDLSRELFREGWRYGAADLRADLSDLGGADAVEALDETRSLIDQGFVYTHQDLRLDLARQGVSLNSARSFVADGYSYTRRYGDPTATRLDRELDAIHRTTATARRYLWTVHVLAVLLLASVAFVGGRSWPTRAAWASAALLASAVASLLAAVLLDHALIAPALDRAHADLVAQSAGPFEDTIQLAADKALELAHTARTDFTGGLQRASLALALASSAALAASLFWASRERRERGV